jgi:glucose-1-phosphate adenylyltransferase
MMCDAIAVVLGGGEGKRLYPLTKYRAKPAVPIAGKFRLVDIPISNCLHSDVDRIFVLTQFNSTPLNRHIVQTYRFDAFSRGYVQILAAQQTQESADWYQGTADAVRQNLRRFVETPCDYILILSGDQLYSMDYRQMIREHIENDAEITVAVLPVERDQVKEFGILKTSADGRITDFMEKPQKDNEIHALKINGVTFRHSGIQPLGRSHVASMGIYIFNKDVLVESLKDESMVDFGKHVIPASIEARNVYAHFFDGYWRDVGTVKSFYEANLELTQIVPEFDFYDESAQVYTHPRFLPGSKINSCVVQSSILCEGSVMTQCEIRNSIIGVRSIVRSGAEILDSVIMGADHYETTEDQCINDETGSPSIGIGRGSIIRKTIVDKNARIGCNVRIVNQQGRKDYDGPNFSIREGIVVVHRNAVLLDDTVI